MVSHRRVEQTTDLSDDRADFRFCCYCRRRRQTKPEKEGFVKSPVEKRLFLGFRFLSLSTKSSVWTSALCQTQRRRDPVSEVPKKTFARFQTRMRPTSRDR